MDDIDGFLVGGASLRSDSFSKIIEIFNEVKDFKMNKKDLARLIDHTLLKSETKIEDIKNSAKKH